MHKPREAVDRDGKKYVEVDGEKHKPFIGLIRQFMSDAGLRGNPADYAVLYGRMLTDVFGHYMIERRGPVVQNLDGKILSVVVHKRFLHRYIRADQAAMFWNPKLGMRAARVRAQEVQGAGDKDPQAGCPVPVQEKA